MHHDARIPLDSSSSDEGPGSVWPVALLAGTASASVFASCAWVGIEACGVRTRVGFGDWVAEHALWGLAAGIVVTWILRLGVRLDPTLTDPCARRAAALRLAVFGALIALVALAISSRAPLERLLPVLGTMVAGLAAVLWLARLWLGSLRRVAVLPRLDPLQVAPVIALLLAPLQDGGAGASLQRAWAVMLGG
jgi:hypothetical protein